MIFSETDTDGFFVREHRVEEHDPRGVNWVQVPPPPIGEAPFFRLEGMNWIPSDTGPAEPPSVYIPKRISKIDFARLFTGAQEVQVNKWEKICKAVPPEEYDDPLNGLTLSVERVLKAFERPLEFIELNHPETRQGLEIMAYVGVFGEDSVAAAAEVERILAGVLPS